MTPCAAGVSSCTATTLDALTGNLLRLFGSGPSGIKEPSTATWQDFYPNRR
jgi:hypothetical protein